MRAKTKSFDLEKRVEKEIQKSPTGGLTTLSTNERHPGI